MISQKRVELELAVTGQRAPLQRLAHEVVGCERQRVVELHVGEIGRGQRFEIGPRVGAAEEVPRVDAHADRAADAVHDVERLRDGVDGHHRQELDRHRRAVRA